MISRTKKVKLSNVLSISSGLWMNEMAHGWAAIDIVSWFGFWPIILHPEANISTSSGGIIGHIFFLRGN